MTTFPSAMARAASRSFSILALVALATLAFAATAEAGNYTVKFCAQGGAGGDKGPFERFGNQQVFALSNNCGNQNGLRISHNAGNSASVGTEAHWLAERPDGISVTQVDYKAAANARSSGYFPRVIGDANGDNQLDVINGDGQLQGSFSSFNVAGDVRRFGVQLICANKTGPECGSNPSNPDVRLKDVTYTLSDPSPPSLSLSGGTLSEGEIQTGGQSIGFSASDSGSGVHRVVVLANGKPAGETRGNCALGKGFGLSFKPCAADHTGAVPVNTAAEPWRNGKNKVQVCAEDYSTDGTANRTCSGTFRVRVLNGCAASPVTTGQTLELQWTGKRKAAVQARQGRARNAVARIFGPNGTPLAGAAVCISRSIPDGRGRERVVEPTAVTGPDGSVAVKVRGASSRTVYATYWVDSETMITNSIEMKVAPRIKLRLRPGGKLDKGKKMLVVAKLRGKWKGGRKVCFYSKKPGNDRIGCSQSAKGGRAKTVYRPKKTGRVYFYAKTPRQKGFPYVNARSKKRHAKVVG